MRQTASLAILGAVATLLNLVTASASASASASGNTGTSICVAESLLETCHQMATAAASQGVLVSCVPARDRFACLEKLSSGSADWMYLDPEDIYLAASFGDKLKVVKDIRTNDKLNERYRSKNVAVVRSSLRLDKMADLRGRRSCHTGIGRNAGLVIAKLAQVGAFAQIRDAQRTSRENELRAVAQLFGSACLVGMRSPDPAENERLKRVYPNLCALCADAAKCDYPDALADADGALRCLTEKGGDVAWTKIFEVNKHFGIGRVRAEGRGRAADFRFLCPDGSKEPLGGNDPCRWGARPWEVFVTGAPNRSVPTVRAAIGRLAELGRASNATWLQSLLGVDSKSSVVNNERPVTPKEYLDIADYAGVISRDFGTSSPLRLCVVSPSEAAKCSALARSAFSRGVRPRIECVVRTPTSRQCMEAVREGHADAVVLGPADVVTAADEFGLQPVLSERLPDGGDSFYSVAVVRRLSKLRTLADLRGSRSCHPSLTDATSWTLPVSTLLSHGLLDAATCPRSKAMSDFFAGGSCVPGAASSSPLCAACVGNQNVTDPVVQRRSRCVQNRNEEFFGEQGAFLCLVSGAGDVAFLRHTTVGENTDGNNLEHWASRLKSDSYELICPNDTRGAVSQYRDCNLGQVAARSVVMRGSRAAHEEAALRDAFLSAAALYGRRPELFSMFGVFNGGVDVLFSDAARGLVVVDKVTDAQRMFATLHRDVHTCTTTTSRPTPSQTISTPRTTTKPTSNWNWNKDTVAR